MARLGSKDLRLLISLSIVCLISLAVAWVGDGLLRERLLRAEAERQAVTWGRYIARSMENLDGILMFGQSVSDGDRIRLQTAAIMGGLKFYAIYDPFGSPLVSSDPRSLNKANKEELFATHIRKGKAFVRIRKNAEFDVGLQRQHATTYAGVSSMGTPEKTGRSPVSVDRGRGTVSTDAPRTAASDPLGTNLLIGEAFVPIMKGGRVIGTLGIHIDTTQAAAMIDRMSFYFKGGVVTLFVVLFVLSGIFVSQNIAGRNKDMLAVSRARDQAASAEAEMRKLNAELEQSLRDLKAAQDELVRKNRLATLGQLTATVSHELRNPLGAVRTAAYLIGRKVADKGLGLEKALERVENGIKRCDNIITELLDFTRTRELAVEDVKFDDWVKSVVDDQELPKPVRVDYNLQMANDRVSLDPERFRRVLINLVSNASEAMLGDGSDPKYQVTESPRIVVETRLSPTRIEVSVADNGPGIAPENREKILEPLFSTKSFGVGLGIPAIQQILETHGGGLEISSEPGNGACFTAWLPRERLVQGAGADTAGGQV